MRLQLKLSTGVSDTFIDIEWNGGDLDSFPDYFSYRSSYWHTIFYDRDDTGRNEYIVTAGEITKASIPCDLYGNTFPVFDMETYLGGGKLPTGLVCECGAKFTDFPNNHMTMCPLWSKN